MSYWHSLLLAVLAGFSVFFSSASKPPPAVAPVPPPVYPLCAAPAADPTLECAIAALDPGRVPWLYTALWQEVSAEPLVFQAEGTYQAGPDRRVRIDMEVRCESARRNWQMICDGQAIWEIDSAGSERPRWQKRVLPGERSGERLTAPPDPSCLGSFAGPGPLLQSLRRDVVFTHLETVRWRARDVILLTGARSRVQTNWPHYHPRQCRLVLDALTLWPHRVEWWGPAPGVAGDIRLVQIEFRQPVLHHPVDESLFTFEPPAPSDGEEVLPGAGPSRSRSQKGAFTGFSR